MVQLNRRAFLKRAGTGALATSLPVRDYLPAGFAAELPASAGQSWRGDWLQFRGDRAFTGRSPLKGNIHHPAIRWQQFLGARETIYSAKFHAKPASSQNVNLSSADSGVDPRIPSNNERLEALKSLDGGGFTSGSQVGKFLPHQPGLQIVQCESCFGKYSSYQPEGTGEYCRLMTQKNGEWQQVWKSQLIPQVFLPNVLAGDFDNDGNMEVAFTPWYDLLVLDMATGKLKAKARFSPPGAESGRAYGYLGAFDVDGDGKMEFVILPDFENQMAVMGWRNGNLTLLWNRLIERGIGNKKTLFRPGAEPVQDIDGDGKKEIVVSLFNTKGDDQWHVIALNAMTGEEKLDIPQSYLTGLRDINGDGLPELFLTTTEGPLIPESSVVTLATFKSGTLKELWHTADSAFETYSIPEFPSTIQNGSSTSGLTVAVAPFEPGNPPGFLTRKVLDRSTGATEISAWQFDSSSGARKLGTMVGPHLSAVIGGSRPNVPGQLYLRAEASDDSNRTIACTSVELSPVFSARVGIPISTAVVAPLDRGSKPSIIVQGAGENLTAIRPHSGGAKVEWRAKARSMAANGKNAGGVCLADLHGDGRLATIAGAVGPKGCARLVAIDSAGKEVWAHDFERFPGERPILNIGGLFYWFAGRFNDPHRDDIVVSLARAQLHSEESFLLDGRTGQELWHRTVGSHYGAGPSRARAFGGGWMAVFDYDGDGLDDIVTMHPDGILAVQGSTAKTLLDRSTNGRVGNGIFPGEWTFFGTPVVADFLGNGKRQMLYGASTYRFALLEMNGDVIWQEPQRATPKIVPGVGEDPPGPFNSNMGNHSTPAILPGIGDADGDGKLELLAPGHSRSIGSNAQDFHCYDAATGRIKWKLPLPGSCSSPNMGSYPDSPTPPAVADVDGDGRDEAVFGIGKTLYAVGASKDGSAGRICWTLDFPDMLGPASIADTRGNGKAEIVVVCADGNVYGVGQAK